MSKRKSKAPEGVQQAKAIVYAVIGFLVGLGITFGAGWLFYSYFLRQLF